VIGASGTHRPSSDRVGIVLATACFIHCVAGPVLLSVAGFAGLIGTSEKMERWFLTGSVLMGTISLIPSYRRRHRQPICLAIFLVGIGLLALRHQVQSKTIPVEPIAAGIGACLIVSAHILDLRLSRRCQCCECNELLPVQQLAHAPGLPLAGDELLIVAQRDQPPLTGESAHLADVIDVDQSVPVNSPKTRVP
jgi:hypothetical protein